MKCRICGNEARYAICSTLCKEKEIITKSNAKWLGKEKIKELPKHHINLGMCYDREN